MTDEMDRALKAMEQAAKVRAEREAEAKAATESYVAANRALSAAIGKEREARDAFLRLACVHTGVTYGDDDDE